MMESSSEGNGTHRPRTQFLDSIFERLRAHAVMYHKYGSVHIKVGAIARASTAFTRMPRSRRTR
jgi:hypothetical protein